MARKKKIDFEYIRSGLADTLIKIAIKYDLKLNDLRILNPDIKSNSARIPIGQKVRIK